MVTKEQFKTGLAMYFEEEFINKVPGLKKWIMVLAANEMLVQADNVINKMSGTSYVSKDGMIDIDKLYNGMIDIDKLYKDLSKVAEKTGDVTENFPLIGDVRFSAKDIDKLYGLIAR